MLFKFRAVGADGDVITSKSKVLEMLQKDERDVDLIEDTFEFVEARGADAAEAEQGDQERVIGSLKVI